MPLRWSFPPYPVAWVPRETLHEYVHGNDPITGVPLMQEIVNALTRPLNNAERNPVIPRREKRPRLLEPDTEANLHRYFLENGWTDGLPIILPTEERVAEMLTGTDHDSQEEVGMMTVTTHEEMNSYTVEKVAVCAVMAGARSEHLPVILAIAETKHPNMPSSTGSYGSIVMVNGPVRNIIGMNCGGAALGPFNYSNGVIGRAWTLMTIIFGDARVGDTFMATIGNGLSFTNQCCGENEERSPYEPFHVRRGFKAEESTVSIFRGWNVMTLGMGNGEQILQRIKNMGGMGTYTFVLDPLCANTLKNDGYETLEQLSEWISKKADSPWLKPEGINFIVVGGETNPIWQSTDYRHYAITGVDKWIPETGIKLDEKPLRMPLGLKCADGSCGIDL
ncbi:MAG TPA: hypothetical protein G4O15_08030 [Dehalococcoidia bacterium]|nr:hypothetical protein [Dehalococcoidia bacterium]